jgi:hypothetical protein
MVTIWIYFDENLTLNLLLFFFIKIISSIVLDAIINQVLLLQNKNPSITGNDFKIQLFNYQTPRLFFFFFSRELKRERGVISE